MNLEVSESEKQKKKNKFKQRRLRVGFEAKKFNIKFWQH